MAVHTLSPDSPELVVSEVLVAHGDTVHLGSPETLLKSSYAQSGSDLVLTTPDGETLIIRGYFEAADPPDLTAPNGATLEADLVAKLAGGRAPAQWAQAGDAPATQPIGEVVTQSGSVRVTRANGETIEASVGDPVFANDVVETADGATIGISFLDETILTVNSGSRMVLDELVYQPEDDESGSMLLSLVTGSFAFISGEIAPTGDMVMRTPVTTLGIRGTAGAASYEIDLNTAQIFNFVDPRTGEVSRIEVYDNSGNLLGVLTTDDTFAAFDGSTNAFIQTFLSNEQQSFADELVQLLEQAATAAGIDVTEATTENRRIVRLDDNDGGAAGEETGAAFLSESDLDEVEVEGVGIGDEGVDDDANRPPVASAINGPPTDEDSTIRTGLLYKLDLLSGQSDPDGDALTAFGLSVTSSDGRLGIPAGSVPPPGVETFEYTFSGSTFSIDPDEFDDLALGETIAINIGYSISDGIHVVPNSASFLVEGRNDTPVIIIPSPPQDLDEAEDTTDSTASRVQSDDTITFSDDDLNDIGLTGTVAAVAIDGSSTTNGLEESLLREGAPDGPAVTLADQLLSLDLFTITDVTKLIGENDGSVTWDFDAPDRLFDYLADGETLTVTYTIELNDEEGVINPNPGEGEVSGTVILLDVTITVTGTNDQPMIEGSVTPADVVPAALVETDTTLSISGTLEITDVDVTDQVTASVTKVTASYSGGAGVTTPGSGDSVAVALGGETPASRTIDNATLKSFLTLADDGAFSDSVQILDDGETADTLNWDFTSTGEAFDFLGKGETLTLFFEVEVVDDSGVGANDTTTQTIEITITGTNDRPEIDASVSPTKVVAGETETDAVVTASGTLAITDADTTDAVIATVSTVSVAYTGGAGVTTPGSGDSVAVALGGETPATRTIDNATLKSFLTLADDGAFSDSVQILDDGETADTLNWDFTSTGEAFDFLGKGETLTLFFEVEVVDDSGVGANDTTTQTIEITITGTNDRPEIDASVSPTKVVAGETETDAVVTASGTLAITDADTTDAVIATVSTVSVAYTGGAGVTTPGSGDSVAVALGGETPATRTIDNATLKSFLTLADDGAFSDSVQILDDGETADTLNWDFTSTGEAFDFLGKDETLVLTYVVTVDDQNGVTTAGADELSATTQTIEITITGTNDRPEIDASVSPTKVVAGETETDATVTASGTLAITDADTTDAVIATVSTVSVAYTGGAGVTTPGSGDSVAVALGGETPATRTIDNATLKSFLTLADDGAFSDSVQILDDGETADTLNWDFTSTGEAFDFLGKDETLVLTYVVTVDDQNGVTTAGADELSATTQTIEITITGTNDRPEIDASVSPTKVVAGETETDATVTASGTLAITDADTTDAVIATVSTVSVAYTGGAGVTTPGSGDSVAVALGGETPATRTIDNATLKSFLTLADDGAFSDSVQILDDGETADTLNWDFTSTGEAFDFLGKDETLVLTYVVTVDDQNGVTTAGADELSATTQTIEITITGTNDRPEIVVNDNTETLPESDSTLSTSGSSEVSDADSTDAVLASITSVSATSTTEDGGGTPQPDATANLDGLTTAQLLTFLSLGTAQILDDGETTDTLGWTFDSDSSGAPGGLAETFDYLADGEVLTLTYTIEVDDQQGVTTAGTDELSKTTETVTITITGTNDTPVIEASSTLTGGLAEQAGVTGDATVLSTGGTIDFSDVDVTDTHSIPAPTFVSAVWSGGTNPTTDPGALLIGAVDQGANTASWTYDITDSALDFLDDGETLIITYDIAVQDSSGVGASDTSATEQIVITITGTNDAPEITLPGASPTVLEDDTVAVSGFTIADVDGEDVTATLEFTSTGTVTAQGSAIVTDNGTSTVQIAGSPTDVTNTLNTLVYAPTPDDNGTGSIKVTVTDGTTSVNDTLSVNITPVNDAPEGSSLNISAFEDVPKTLSAGDFGFTDPNDTPGDAFAAVKITTLPTAGTLTLNAAAVTAGDVVSIADITAGNLVYTSALNDNGSASFTFQVQDDGGTANGGVDLDPTPNTLTFNIQAVNDAPTLSATSDNPFHEPGTDPPASVFSGAAADTIESTQTFTSMTLTVDGVVDGVDEVLNFDGTSLALVSDGGTPVTTANNSLSVSVSEFAQTATVTFSSASLTAAELQTLVDGITYSNTGEPPTDGTRTMTITEIVDSGGTTNGGVDTTALNLVSTVEVVAGEGECEFDPIILDLDGDGAEFAAGFVGFDFDGNGAAETIGWVGGDDGLLVVDTDGDGLITTGAELVSPEMVEGTATSLEALGSFDHNGDGVIDERDDIFNALQIWQDANEDGITDTGELHALTDLGITSIGLAATSVGTVDANGNATDAEGTFTYLNGSEGEYTQVTFADGNSGNGDNGSQTFAIEEDAAVDTLLDFDAGLGGDTLDLSGLLDDNFDPGTNQGEYISTRQEDGNTVVSVDFDGSGAGAGPTDVATLEGTGAGAVINVVFDDSGNTTTVTS